jgi:polar amino acid transport system permease protein
MSTLSLWGEFLPEFLPGLWVSVKLTLASLAVGLPFGVVLGVATSSKARVVRMLTVTVVEIGRGAPGLIVLYLVYYGLPQAGLNLTGFVAAVVGLGFSTAAYSAEIFRAGIAAVPRGQVEAAAALGIGSTRTFRLVVLPQALRLIVPSLVGFSILVFQATSLAFAIAVPELLSRAYNTASITYQFTASLTLAGLLYAAVSLVGVFLVRTGGRARPAPRVRTPGLTPANPH